MKTDPTASTDLSATPGLANSTLYRGIKLFELMARSGDHFSVAGLARDMELPKSHIHRLLQTLTDLGYVTRPEGSRKYCVDVQVFELATAVADNHPLNWHGGPFLRQLADRGKGSASLVVWHRASPMTILGDSYQGRRTGSGFAMGRRHSVHASASGKLFAALLKVDVDTLDLAKINEHTITGRRAFQKQMKEIRANGCSVNRMENNDKAYSFAAPVYDGEEHLVAAMTLAVDKRFVKRHGEERFTEWVMDAAEGLSARLGCPVVRRANTQSE